MLPEARVEHLYPAGLPFLRRHGGHALAVLHDLLTHAERRDGQLVVRASTREIAARLEFLSKDSVNRRLRDLVRDGVLEVAERGTAGAFQPATYVLHLDDTGITLIHDRPA